MRMRRLPHSDGSRWLGSKSLTQSENAAKSKQSPSCRIATTKRKAGGDRAAFRYDGCGPRDCPAPNSPIRESWVRILAASPKCQECIVKQLFRYAFGRRETSSRPANDQRGI